MRLIAIPPYKNPAINFHFVLEELVKNYRKNRALEGVELDLDEGSPIGSALEVRDEGFATAVREGVLKKAKEYSETGKYDAIIGTGGIDPAFALARSACKVPFIGALHSCVHLASLAGEKFTIIHSTGFIRNVEKASGIMKNLVESYGFGSKLTSVKIVGLWAEHTHGFVQYVYEFLIKYKDNWAARLNDPDLKKVIDDVITNCITAIEKEGANTVIIPCEHLTACADGVREGLNKAGYNNIPIICGFPAGLEVARAMVDTKCMQIS